MTQKSSHSEDAVRDIFDALKHPLRRRVLRVMVLMERSTPKDVADELAEDLSNVSYHVRFLAECRVVNLVLGDTARGGERHFYEVVNEEPWVRGALGLPYTSEGSRPSDDLDPEADGKAGPT